MALLGAGAANLKATYLHRQLACLRLWHIVGGLQVQNVSAWTLESRPHIIYALAINFILYPRLHSSSNTIIFFMFSHTDIATPTTTLMSNCKEKDQIRIKKAERTIISTNGTGQVFLEFFRRIVLFVLFAKPIQD